MSPLTLDSQPLIAGVLITASGELDSTNDLHLESFIIRAYRPGHALVLDLAGLTFMDGRGLSILLRLNAFVRRSRGALHLANVSDVPARLLQLTGIWDTLSIHTSVEAAIAQTLHDYPAPPSQRRGGSHASSSSRLW